MTTTSNPFQPAVKAQLKARVAFDGPTGAGKTWTALSWATVLAGDDGKIAFIDTERDSARLYANHYRFDVLRFDPPYEVARLVDLLKTAEANGYDVVVVDSLSHFWEGEGGVLDEVDAAANRSFGGSSFAGWKHGTPLQRHMVDTFLSLDMHVIVCMRSKMEYVLTEYVDSKGKTRTRPEKVGMAPVQRSGLEYEFTVVGDMDLEHRITFSKSRCDVLGKTTVQPDREREAAEVFLAWLNDGEPLAGPDDVAVLLEAMNSIADDADRKTTKALFVDAFGKPDTLRVSQLDEARAFVAERLASSDGSGSDVPARVTDPEPSDSSTAGEPSGGAGDSTDLPDEGSEPDEMSSNGHGAAASPAAKQACVLCGSTRSGLDPGPDGPVCTVRAACAARQEANHAYARSTT